MKKLLLLLLFIPLLSMAQTSFSETDIDAAAGNGYETLLTNVEPAFPDMSLQLFLQNELQMVEVSQKATSQEIQRAFKSKARIGKEAPQQLEANFYLEPNGDHGIVNQVKITGDWNAVVKVFTGFWSRTLNLRDVSPGEIASTRFLTDVATIKLLDDGTGMITVVTAKDRH